MDPITGAAIIGAGVGVGGGLFGLSSAKDAAKQSWKRSLWWEQNKYSVQRSALEAGGYNPVLAMGAQPPGRPVSPVSRTEAVGRGSEGLGIAAAQATSARTVADSVGRLNDAKAHDQEQTNRVRDLYRDDLIRQGTSAKKAGSRSIERGATKYFKWRQKRRDVKERERSRFEKTRIRVKGMRPGYG